MYLSPKERKSALSTYWTLALGAWILPLIIMVSSLMRARASSTSDAKPFTEADFILIVGLLGAYVLTLAFIYAAGMILRSVLMLHQPYDEGPEPVKPSAAGKNRASEVKPPGWMPADDSSSMPLFGQQPPQDEYRGRRASED